MSGSLNVGPRVMISRAGLDRTGLIGIGSRASERYLFRLDARRSPASKKCARPCKKIFPMR